MKSKSRIFITGANGLLATNTIIQLLSQGYIVRGLLRDINKYVGPKHKNLELIKGDILNKNKLIRDIKNCDYAVHIAALTDQNRTEYIDYEQTNVNGTKNVAFACKINKVKKLVYVSTANVFGHGNKSNLGNEDMSMKEPFTSSYYAVSKLRAQEFIKTYSKDLEVSIINPTFMIGPYDVKPSSGKIIVMGLKNSIVFCPPGGKNFVSVSDVSKAIIKSLKKSINRDAIIIANENMTFMEFFKRLRMQSNKKYRIVKIPKYLMLSIGYFGNLLHTLGINSNLSLNNMKILCLNNFYSNKKSIRNIEMHYEPFDKSLNVALKWFEKRYNNY
ncbi:MAG: NAD-dependent epimerase/dehydratase family protein [Flavobacteriaceae bacterium]|nr:NAD-dependent epimerase/dehydratase family protein [Flavobacteriaceae bacterium]